MFAADCPTIIIDDDIGGTLDDATTTADNNPVTLECLSSLLYDTRDAPTLTGIRGGPIQ